MTNGFYQRPSGKESIRLQPSVALSEAPMLIPAAGFTNGRKRRRQNPLFYRDEDGAPFASRSLDGWQKSPYKEWATNCVIITGESKRVGRPNTYPECLHSAPETHQQWLSGESGKEILRPFPAKEMTARLISKRINKPENNDPSVLEEGEMEQAGRLI